MPIFKKIVYGGIIVSVIGLGIRAVITSHVPYSVLETSYPYVLPPLPYAYDGLEPAIDTATMKLHHDKHHQAYINALNEALKDHPDLQKKTLAELLGSLNEIAEPLRTSLRNNGGGHANHSFFWESMAPATNQEPAGELKEFLVKKFGTVDEFKKQFNSTARTLFGSGWVWLVLDSKGDPVIMTTANQDNPYEQGFVSLLGMDVWEHAYYLKYQNRRADYADAWWSVVNWPEVEKRYMRALKIPSRKS
jgi:superoxide dismutase, Fe-Mn family